MAAMMAGAVVTAEGLWMPGKKLISIPKSPGVYGIGLLPGTEPKPNTVNFTVTGLEAGDRVYVYDANTYEAIVDPYEIRKDPQEHSVVYEYDREVKVRVRNSGPTHIRSIDIPTTITNEGFYVSALRILDI